MGTPDPATGKMHTGVRMGADSAGAVSLALLDGNGAATGVNYTIDETGHTFAGKVTVTGRLDPTTLEFTPTATTSVPGTDYGLWVRTADKALVYSKAGVDTVVGAAASVLASSAGAVGNVGAGEDTLKSYTLPAATLSATGDTLRVTAWGTMSGANETGRVKLYFGGTGGTLLNSATFSENDSGPNPWRLTVHVVRTGAATQEASSAEQVLSSSPTTRNQSPTEALSGTVDILLTGENTTGTTNDQAVCVGFMVELLKA